MGDNTVKAFLAFERANGFAEGRQITAAMWQRLGDLGRASGDASQAQSLAALAAPKKRESAGASSRQDEPPETKQVQDSQDALVQVAITDADLRGPFARKIPESMRGQAGLRRLSYGNADEKLGEQYHSSPGLLHALNPGVEFHRKGQRIWVPNIHTSKSDGKLAKIVADKRFATVTAYGDDGRIVALYPATIGSEENPRPMEIPRWKEWRVIPGTLITRAFFTSKRSRHGQKSELRPGQIIRWASCGSS